MQKIKHYTGISRFTVLHRYRVFYKLRACGNPALSKSISAIFLTAFALCISGLYFGNSHNAARVYYYYICHDNMWSVIFDVITAKRL